MAAGQQVSTMQSTFFRGFRSKVPWSALPSLRPLIPRKIVKFTGYGGQWATSVTKIQAPQANLVRDETPRKQKTAGRALLETMAKTTYYKLAESCNTGTLSSPAPTSHSPLNFWASLAASRSAPIVNICYDLTHPTT